MYAITESKVLNSKYMYGCGTQRIIICYVLCTFKLHKFYFGQHCIFLCNLKFTWITVQLVVYKYNVHEIWMKALCCVTNLRAGFHLLQVDNNYSLKSLILSRVAGHSISNDLTLLLMCVFFLESIGTVKESFMGHCISHTLCLSHSHTHTHTHTHSLTLLYTFPSIMLGGTNE